MLKDKQAVIFDLDGSLVDSMWIWPEVDNAYMVKYKLTPPEDFHHIIEGMSYTETAQYFLDTFPTLTLSLEEVKQEWYDMTLDLYRTKVALKPGALEFLQQMKEAKIPVGIASSNTKGLIEAVLEALDIRSYFTSIRTSCEVRAGKPAPDVYLKVAEDLQVDPTHCLVFEDVINGILAGKNAKMCVCAVDDSFSKTDESRKRELADFFIHDYYEILNGTYHVGGLQTEGKEE